LQTVLPSAGDDGSPIFRFKMAFTMREKLKFFPDEPTMLFRMNYIASDKRDDPTICKKTHLLAVFNTAMFMIPR